jgi:hypothetical protein
VDSPAALQGAPHLPLGPGAHPVPARLRLRHRTASPPHQRQQQVGLVHPAQRLLDRGRARLARDGLPAQVAHDRLGRGALRGQLVRRRGDEDAHACSQSLPRPWRAGEAVAWLERCLALREQALGSRHPAVETLHLEVGLG